MSEKGNYLWFRKINRTILPAIFLTISFLSHALQAQVNVSGKVTSKEDGSPIPGVTILIKGTTSGTVSDAQGKFALTVAGATDVLVFSYVGFLTQEASLAGRNTLDIQLESDIKQLSEVVVTALGIEKAKEKVGYSTQEVKGSDLVRAREPNPINSLVGKIAGLNVGVSAELLGPPNLQLRGSNTVLFVVDGVPIQSDTWNISPDDIETYSVLKGPAASALYGSRGINGAIIITTKRGSKSQRGFSVEVNSSTMMDKGYLTIPKYQDEYGPGDHGHYAYVDGKTGFNDADYDIWGPKFGTGNEVLIPQYDSPVVPGQTFLTTFADGVTWTGDRQPTPWTARGKDNLKRFLQPGILSTNNVAVSAAGANYDLRFSYTHGYQRGIVPNTQLDNDNFNISAGYDFSDKLRFESNLNYNRQYTPNFPDVQYGPNSMIYNVIIWGAADWSMDDMKDYWEDGREGIQQKYAEHTRYNNPWFLAKEWLRGHYKTDIYGYMSLKYKFNNKFDMTGRTQVNTYDLFRNEKFPYSATVYGRELAMGDYREDTRNLFENNTDVLFNYKTSIGEILQVNASAGGNLRTFNYRSSYVTTNYLNVPASSLTPGAYSFDNSLNPVLAYNFKAPMAVYSAYWLADATLFGWANFSLTGRWDKHSTLPVKNNTYFYPSASTSLVLSKALELPEFISFLKIRGAYAKVSGSFNAARIGPPVNPLGYGSTFTTPYDGPSYLNSGVYSSSLVYGNQLGSYFSSTLPNPNLKPSESSSNEIGLDVQFMNGKLGLDATFFRNIDGPGITTLPLAESTGFNGAIVNGGKTKRQGVELVINTTPFQNSEGVTWKVLANWSTFRRTYLEFADGQTRNGFYSVGDRVDGYYAGAFYRTPDGQLINDAGGRPIRTAVAQFLGNLDPNWSWGLTNKFSYRNWALTVQVDGRVGGILVNYIQRQTFRGGRHIATTQDEMGVARANDVKGIRSWVGPGVQISNGAAIQYDPLTGAITNNSELQFTPNTTATFLQDYISRYYAAEETNVMSRSFAKLREITLSYQVPNSVLQKTGIQAATISAVGRNLLYFAAKTDVDIDQFADSNAYSSLQTPTLRRIGFNINVTF